VCVCYVCCSLSLNCHVCDTATRTIHNTVSSVTLKDLPEPVPVAADVDADADAVVVPRKAISILPQK